MGVSWLESYFRELSSSGRRLRLRMPEADLASCDVSTGCI